MQNYITEMQRQKLIPLLELSKEIIMVGTCSGSYYNADTTVKKLAELKGLPLEQVAAATRANTLALFQGMAAS